jgi:hypothetical protein
MRVAAVRAFSHRFPVRRAGLTLRKTSRYSASRRFSTDVHDFLRLDPRRSGAALAGLLLRRPVLRAVAGRRVPPLVSLRTLPVLGLLLAFGAVVLAFTYYTVQRRGPAEMEAIHGVARTHYSIQYWLDHGYFATAGMLVRPVDTAPGHAVYRSSTGGHLVSGFLLQKAFKVVAGRTSLTLLALHNQVVTLLVAALFGLLAFRLTRRAGLPPLHALVLAAAVELVHFTFPDNLATYWELTGRAPFLLFAAIFLLIEERCLDGRTRPLTIAQGIAAFLLAYMEYAAGFAFIASYFAASLMLSPRPVASGRLVRFTLLPAMLAAGLYLGQRVLVGYLQPELPEFGSGFLFRTGLDGSTQYYAGHLDIAYGRDVARGAFLYNGAHLFRWAWLFWAGASALVAVVLLGALGRAPRFVLIPLLSLLGSYLLYAAVFSQAVTIHPYYFDVLLFTPLVLALLAVLPSLLESWAKQPGVFVLIVCFVAAWVCMVQLRDYALRYPVTPPAAAAWNPSLPHAGHEVARGSRA